MVHLELQHTTARPEPVFVVMEIIDAEGQELYKGKSALFTLAPGTNIIRSGDLTIQPIRQAEEQLQEGSYLLCVKVFTQRNQQILSQTCQQQTFGQPEWTDHTPEQSNTSDPLVTFHGTMRMTGQLSNQYFPHQDIPPSYVRWELVPTLTVKQIPLTGSIFLSTEQNSLRYDANTASLNLDRQQLQANLQRTAVAKLREEAHKKAKGLPFDAAFLNQVEEIRETEIQKLQGQMRKFPKISEEELMQSISELNRVEHILDHPSFNGVDKAWKAWEKDIPSLSWEQSSSVKDSLCLVDSAACLAFHQLMSKKEELDKLRERQAELNKVKVYAQKYQQQLQALSNIKDDRSFLQDPDVLRQLPLFNKAQRFLSSVETLGMGINFPTYSPFLLEGISLKGLDVAVNPGKFHIAFSGGQLGKSFLPQDTLFPQPSGYLYAGRIGIGNKQDNYLRASLLHYIPDSVGSLPNATAWIYGVEGQLFLAQRNWRIQGEWAQTASETPQDAWKIETEANLFDGKTQIKAHHQKVMPGYFSPGAPLLLADQERSDIQVNQQLWQGKMILSAYYRKFQDIPFLYKLNQSTVQAAGGRLSLHAPKLPSLQVDIAPFYQRQHQQDSLLSSQYQGLISAQLGHAYQIGNMTGNSRLMYSQQIGRSSLDGGDFSAFMLSFIQLVNIGSALNVQATTTYLQADYSTDYNETLSVDVSANATLLSKWITGLGGTHLQEAGEAGLSRKGIYAYSRFPLSKQLMADLRLERNQYINFGPDRVNRNEYVIRGGISLRW